MTQEENMRSIWTGSLSVSLINLPIKLGSAVKDNHLGLHRVRKQDGSRIRYSNVAEVDGKEVEWRDIAKGYEAPDGSIVILERADFERAYGPKSRVANMVMFTEAGNVPPMAYGKAYWVQPDVGGDKTYALLAHSLQQSGKVAIVSFAMRDREAIAVLRPHDGYLSLEPLEWDADMIRPDFKAPENTASEQEQELALKLIEQHTEKYDHTEYTDKSTEAVMAVIQAKIETNQVIKPPQNPDKPAGLPADLTAVLQAAVDKEKKNPTPAPKPARATTRRKAA